MSILTPLLGSLTLLVGVLALRVPPPQPPTATDPVASNAILALLPEGAEKRRFILDCTGCHGMDAERAFPAGRVRTDAEWQAITGRMLRMAGATTGFPVIAASRDSVATAAWLVRYLTSARVPVATPKAARPEQADVEIREYPVSEPNDLPHDVAVTADGRVAITGMFTSRMLLLDPATGEVEGLPIPLPNANPRAVEIDSAGRWWIVLGGPRRVARYDPRRGPAGFTFWDAGMYAHSVALAPSGAVWLNGHFTRAPELIARVDTTADGVVTQALPPHPTLANVAGGPVPYEIRAAPDGRIWTSELQGNRLVAFDPATGRSDVVGMPEPDMGPRRLDIDARGVLWVPAYSANRLLRIDPAAPAASRVTSYTLPLPDALPYVARVHPRTGDVWIGTGAADHVLRFTPASGRFRAYRLPSRGAMVRHLAFDPRNGDVWLAYGASPGPVSSRVARVRVLR